MATTQTIIKSQNIDFFVLAKDDLYLEGNNKRLLRVSKGYSYSVQMVRNQQMSCLFRHFGKHHGLEKEDLEFTFVDKLQNEDTPESIHLMPSDQIIVSRRRLSNDESSSNSSQGQLDLLSVLKNPLHSDITFIVGEESTRITCHKAIICARSDYFANMFQPNGLSESRLKEVRISSYTSQSFTVMLEYLYTGAFQVPKHAKVDDLINIVLIADEYLLELLKIMVSKCLCSYLKEDTVVTLMVLASKYKIKNLLDSCIRFIQLNKNNLLENPKFAADMANTPEMGLLIMSALPVLEDVNHETNNPNKRRRVFNT
jgi:speckle-type POZ protein